MKPRIGVSNACKTDDNEDRSHEDMAWRQDERHGYEKADQAKNEANHS